MALAFQLAFDRSRVFYGGDYRIYRDAAVSWLSGGGFYKQWQLSGHYVIAFTGNYAILYPPVILWLLVPFVYLPWLLWWVLPITAVAHSLWRLRPSIWAWCVLLAVFDLWHRTPELFIWGNPGMWAVAALFLGVLYDGPAVLVLLKPSLAPFALSGVRSRRWWAVLIGFLVACVPFAGMWGDYLRVLLNSNGTLAYSLADVPAMCLPLVAWAGRDGRTFGQALDELAGILGRHRR